MYLVFGGMLREWFPFLPKLFPNSMLGTCGWADFHSERYLLAELKFNHVWLQTGISERRTIIDLLNKITLC